MDAKELWGIKKKSLSGVIALTTRSLFLQIIAFGATFLLTIFLSPQVFGVFYVVSAFISFLAYFSDIGLAAALIQKKEELNAEDVKTTFTLQQLLIGALVIGALYFSSYLATWYRLGKEGEILLQILILSLFISSLKTIPSVFLERQLDFQKLIVPNILETITFYSLAVYLAWNGFGITSFTYAVAARSLVGLVAIYWISPWKPSLGINLQAARKLLRFGVPFQLNSFLALLKDDLLTIFLGKVLPLSQIGYIGWAKKWSEIPLRLIMDNIIRVTFPAFSRLQLTQKYLSLAIENTLFGLTATVFPITVSLLFLIKPFIGLFPKYTKWEPALISFYFFAVSSALAGFSTPLTNTLNATGKIKITLFLMIFWTISTWILTVLGINLFGFHGYSVALFIISTTVVLVIYLAKKITPFSFWKSIKYPFYAVIPQIILLSIFKELIFTNIFWLIILGLSGVILYLVTLWQFEKARIAQLIKTFTQTDHE